MICMKLTNIVINIYLYYYKIILTLVVISLVGIFDLPNNYLFVPSKTNHNKNDGVCIFFGVTLNLYCKEDEVT